MRNFKTLVAALILGLSWAGWVAADDPRLRDQSRQLMQDGNFREALAGFKTLCEAQDSNPALVSEDLRNAHQCLQRLGEIKDFDELLESTVAAHGGNWRLLETAGQLLLTTDHSGFLVGGKFERGPHRGGGRMANSYDRDRVRALQLSRQAMALAVLDDNKADVANLLMGIASQLTYSRGGNLAWELQALTDLEELPDYEEGYFYRGQSQSGAPVDESGKPIVYGVPDSWEAAVNDGERWRWVLAQVVENNPARMNEVRYTLAGFAMNQFGVQTMQQGMWFMDYIRRSDDGEVARTYDLHTLGEDETIAKLASGIQRFTLPEEYRYIHIYRQIIAEPRTGYAEQAYQQLASIFENRRQYPTAAQTWRKNIEEYGPGNNDWKKQRLDQIVGNWGTIEPTGTQPAGEKASFEYRFRNGTQVKLQAKRLDVSQLLADIKTHLKSNPRRLDYSAVNLSQLGYRLVREDLDKYFVGEPIEWEHELDPRDNHFDRRVTLDAPLTEAGAYFVEATINQGNTTRFVLWVADSVIVNKRLDNETLYFLADATTGAPIADANLEFFGYKAERVGRTNQMRILTSNFAEETDRNGMSFPSRKDLSEQMTWMTIARKGDRLAFLGFQGVWTGRLYDQEYNQIKSLVITDRPVYRPGDEVEFKIWTRRAQYERDTESQFAGQTIAYEIRNPKGDKVDEQTAVADEYGGITGTYTIPSDATLGQFVIVTKQGAAGGNTFRVEEYKKPEFEVTVDSPSEPIKLGDKIEAKVTARYLFGAPVTEGTLKYKVMRESYQQNWYPIAPWDWCYGSGYWWFCYDYPWYPGYQQWVGCARPSLGWIWQPPGPPPEVVAEGEVQLNADGTFDIEIDTAFAKEVHGKSDHKYSITAEVRDASRRTIVGSGEVLVAREAFKVFTWVDRGYFRVGDNIQSHVKAQRLDGKPVVASGEMTLYKISYDADRAPIETAVSVWQVETNETGELQQQMTAASAGQYRLSTVLTDEAGNEIEGGYIFTVVGEGFDGEGYRFNALELIPEKREYQPGEQVHLQVNADQDDATVLFFLRPANGIGKRPELMRFDGKSQIKDFEVLRADMPNFFVEVLTVSGGRVYTEVKEIVVPPEKRVLNVEVLPSAERYRPGEKAKVQVHVTDHTGENFQGAAVLSIYDKAVEYISGGSNVPDIREFFWKWRRQHQAQTISSLMDFSPLVIRPGERNLQPLGVFGNVINESLTETAVADFGRASEMRSMNGVGMGGGLGAPMAGGRGMVADAAMEGAAGFAGGEAMKMQAGPGGAASGGELVQPTVRSNFADTALWAGTLVTDATGMAEVELDMPENLTTWKINVWGMGHGTRVGQGTAEVITSKDLLVRLQAPRFFVERDEVVLSANVHNYLSEAKQVTVRLELPGDQLVAIDPTEVVVTVPADGEQRVDWRVNVAREGEARIVMSALTDEESDAMEMTFPVYLHGAMRQESWAGTVRPGDLSSTVTFEVPDQRRVEDTRLELRYSPSLASAMIDALPYLVDYPYGCTEQTLNRWLPTVMTQKTLIEMNVDLQKVDEFRTNLNAQEIGDTEDRAAQWKRFKRNPVFDRDEVDQMVKDGLKALASMQVSDGGWGWFSGYGERSYPHTTAVVVHGLQTARSNDVALVPGLLENGIEWLKRYQEAELTKLKNDLIDEKPRKKTATNIDALVYRVLVDEGIDSPEMREFLYRDRNGLSVYGKTLLALAVHRVGDAQKLNMLKRNIEQFLVEDAENETAYLKMPETNYWWSWYGSEIEANACYLSLLTRVDPAGVTAPRMVKYLLNNRKHATYWGSTRDTALCVESFAEFVQATAENRPDMEVEVWLDGELRKTVEITSENLFTFDNQFVVEGADLASGEHTLELRRRGDGPLYFNQYLTNFTMVDDIPAAGLEVKVERKFYRLDPIDKEINVAGDRGQVLSQKVEKYERVPVENLDSVTSGDLIEVELLITSKNDYEYLLFEDYKAAGFEPVEVRSGYNGNEMGAYVEYRDEKVAFFVRRLARGEHSLSYRLRAETPGRFSALPAQASAMYAPELRGNSSELKVIVNDQTEE